MSGYPHIAYTAATNDLVRELMSVRNPLDVEGRVDLYPSREEAEVNNTDPEATVRGVIIDVPHRGCFRASVQSRGDSPAGWVVDNHWFTHFGMAYEFLQLRAPRHPAEGHRLRARGNRPCRPGRGRQ